MKRRLVVRPAAEQELREARIWYEQRRDGLGDELLDCVDAALTEISKSPERFPRVHGEIRRLLVRRFPFGVFYVVTPSSIVVLAVFHAHRDPIEWRGRR